MPKYLLEVRYSVDGAKGLMKEGGSSRRSTVEDLVKGMGGNVESFYYAFGERDCFVIVEMPDDTSMAAVSIAVGASGGAAITTTALLDPEVIDAAVHQTVAYRPPGK